MDSQSDHHFIERLADEFAERLHRGEKPTIGEYVDRFPEFASEIQEVLPALVMMDQVVPASDDLRDSGRVTRQSLEHETLGDYRILREIGRGGMGIVYEAEQLSLRRRVALKVLPKQFSSDERSLQRFEREARAAARMHHTNIVPVFDVGHSDDWFYYAMQLIQGQGLDLVITELVRLRSERLSLESASRQGAALSGEQAVPAEPSIAASLMVGEFRKERLSCGIASAAGMSAIGDEEISDQLDSAASSRCTETIALAQGSASTAVLPGRAEMSSAESDRMSYFRSVAEIGKQAAQALGYAHSRGIIHRDIKPPNLLLDAAGTVWVTDFGLAKTSDDGMTHTGDILGTIRYMSPERFRGQCDHRSDIYALGLTLYELLVLRPAFASPDRLRLIEMVTKTEPPSPRSIDSRIPRDLETIVLKCIDKDARRRYQNAEDVADDLQRFVADEPIQARRTSSVERLMRWSRRNRPLAASLVFAALLLLIINIVGPIMYLQMRRSRDEEKDAKELAVKAKTEAQQSESRLKLGRYQLDMQRVRLHYEDGHPGAMRQVLERYQPASDSQAAPDWGWRYWWNACHLETREMFCESDAAFGGAPIRLNMFELLVAEDESWVAVNAWPNIAVIYDGKTWKEITSLNLSEWVSDERQHVAVSADGQLFAAIASDDRIRFWRTRDWVEIESLSTDPARDQILLAFSSTGLLAVGDSKGRVTLWNVDQRSSVGSPIDTGQSLSSLAFSPTGEQLLTGGEVRVDGHNQGSEEPPFGSLMAWDVDRQVSGDVEQQPRILSAGDRVTAVDCASHGNGLIVAGFLDGTVRLWDGVTFEERSALKVDGPVGAVKFSEDGARLAASSLRTNQIQIWETETGVELNRINAHSRRIGGMAFVDNGETLLSNGGDFRLKAWDVDDSRAFRQWQLDGYRANLSIIRQVSTVGFCAERPELWHFQRESGLLQRLDTTTGEVESEIGLGARILPFICSDNGRFAIGLSQSGAGELFGEIWCLDGESPILVRSDFVGKLPPGFDPDSPESLRVENSRSFSLEGERPGDSAIADDGSVHVWSFGNQVFVKRVDSDTALELSIADALGIYRFAFSPDGRYLAGIAYYGDAMHKTHIWELSDGKVVSWGDPLDGSTHLSDAKFSFDGQWYAEAKWTNEVRLVHLQTGQVFDLRRHSGSARSLAFSPTEPVLASGGDDGLVHMWKLDLKQPRFMLTLAGHRSSIRSVAFSSDGIDFVSVSLDGEVRVHKSPLELAGVTPGSG